MLAAPGSHLALLSGHLSVPSCSALLISTPWQEVEEDENEEEPEDDVAEDALAQASGARWFPVRSEFVACWHASKAAWHTAASACSHRLFLGQTQTPLSSPCPPPVQPSKKGGKAGAGKKKAAPKGAWVGAATKTEGSLKFYAKAKVGGGGAVGLAGLLSWLVGWLAV